MGGSSNPFGYLRLVRPVNCAIAFASVAVGAGMAGEISEGHRILSAGLSAACIAGGGNALNDACDEAEDRINRPDRPIPSGAVSRRGASLAAAVLFGVGLALSIRLGPMAVWVALAAAGGLVAYDIALKRVPVLGNATVGVISALALIYGGVAAHHPGAALIPAGFAFLFHLGREVLKDIEDMRGDASVGTRSVALTWGVRPALMLTTVVYLLLMALTPIPFWQGTHDSRYMLLALCVDSILIYSTLSMWRDPSRRNLLRLDGLLKGNMALGLLALWVGRT